MAIQQAIKQAIAHTDIDYEQMLVVFREIMSGDSTPAQIAGLLVALNMKGETIDEVTAAATVMREFATKVNLTDSPTSSALLDTCGTGGDGSQTFNISTAVAFVASAAGAPVAKHGNRSVSSSSGSADVLECLGVNINLNAASVAACIENVGIGFMFAPAHHSATRYAAGPRKELGVRTLFNVLGPLTNPANAPVQLMGIFDQKWQNIVIEVLARLGTRRAFVVTADDGLDEISIASNTRIASLENGDVSFFELDPQDYGFSKQSTKTLRADNAEHSASIITDVLEGRPGPAFDIVALNAGAAIYLCGLCNGIEEGVEMARQTITAGTAKNRLQELVEYSRACD